MASLKKSLSDASARASVYKRPFPLKIMAKDYLVHTVEVTPRLESCSIPFSLLFDPVLTPNSFPGYWVIIGRIAAKGRPLDQATPVPLVPADDCFDYWYTTLVPNESTLSLWRSDTVSGGTRHLSGIPVTCPQRIIRLVPKDKVRLIHD